jgi:hypothetical protein
MATTYLDGTTHEDLNDLNYIGKTTLRKGTYETGNHGEVFSQTVYGRDTPFGHIDVGPSSGILVDRAPNVPSGFTANYVPTYGNGKLNRVTTFADDRSGPNPNTPFDYFRPLAPVKKRFRDLV